ncbi:MAG: glycosyltransferase family 4 protein [Chloroflexales bacterium]|nr:glycosyltransferase family 4 protein [Chloroflexales bacterium]
MHIAMLAPITWRVPPRAYGPWEQVASVLTEGLVARGVDVTLFATADSQTRARLVGTCPCPLAEDPSLDPKVWEGLHIAALFERAAEFDLIHNHLDFLPLTYSRLVATPMLTTIHGFSSARILPAYQAYDGHVAYVAISAADRRPELTYLATVHHRLDLTRFTPWERPDDYLLFLGRIHPDKGAVEAIEVARRAGRRLILAGLVHDEAYFQRQVWPLLDDDRVRYIGPVGPEQRDEILGHATALLHLIAFDEPFGLSMAEAMACGTPVIAFARGAVPEIVRHGETGFIVGTLAEAVHAVDAAALLDRGAIHRYAAAAFSQERMVDAYLGLYAQLLDRRVGVTAREGTVGAAKRAG